ncbi:heterokaryon incompatibility protein-domain-containing protein [Microdochium bolleyi]|uniref:Heterokaryon incompatibility protein-domain-containing protein n=1 Tax=Microdochium bolleyi TaxID=196109 RepID=A0A136JGC0_9PEZI|nr:heterokaryon incompatibility protein-domain-containing protein [Microdochium bolleyi]
MAAILSKGELNSHHRPYRITDTDRNGELPTTKTPHVCTVCEPLMVLVGGNVMSEHSFTFSEVIAALPNQGVAATAARDNKECKFMAWCLHLIDIRWGRPKSGESLIARMLKMPGRVDTAKLVVQISATAALGASQSDSRKRESSIDKVAIRIQLVGAPEFARSLSQDFKVFAEHDDAAAQYFASRPIRPILQSFTELMLKTISARMIKYNHLSSSLRLNEGLPARLVDLGPNNNEINPRLITVVPGWSGQYVCLSYCWGGDQPLKATTNNLSSLSNPPGFPYHDLPKTLRDACLITKLMDQRYIWIDALCIVQDDPADKAREIPKMRNIYKGALLTIVASRSTSADQGFLKDRLDTLVESDNIFKFKFGVEKESPGAHKAGPGCRVYRAADLCPAKDPQEAARVVKIKGIVTIFKPGFNLNSQTLTDPLQSRAWAFQERLLSSRVIDFSSYQTSLQDEFTGRECQIDGGWVTNKTTTESLTSIWDIIRETSYLISCFTHASLPIDRADSAGSVSTSQFFNNAYQVRVWAIVVQEYTKLGLSVPTDKLAAIEGLAEWFGLWLKVSRSTRRTGESEATNTEALSTSQRTAKPRRDSTPNAGGEIRYLAGIWSHHLPAGLMWHVDVKPGMGSLPPFQSTTNSQQDGFGGVWGHTLAPELRNRPQPWRAPSWAWSSVESPVAVPHHLHADQESDGWPIKAITASVVSMKITPCTQGDVYGPVSDGYLVLDAPMFPVICQRNWDGTMGHVSAASGISGARFGTVTFDACSSDDEGRLCTAGLSVQKNDTSGFTAWCVQILLRPTDGLTLNSPDPRIREQPAGLVLLEVPGMLEETFTRIGTFESELRATEPRASFEALEAWRAGFEIRRITII